jgi:molybdate transport system ATP-binding protein
MIDVDIGLAVSDRRRRFELAMRFATDAASVALYGPSGAGKSLTLQALAGLLRPQRGHVRVAGRTLFDAAAGVDVPASERRIGYLFQNYALFPHLSVRDNVGFGLTSWRRRIRPADAQRVDDLLTSFGLADVAASKPDTLSGGQAQRVALARALACEPALLLLDEPFAALNPMLRAGLRLELAAVRARWRIPMLMITHDVEDVLALAQVAILVDGGQARRQVDLRSAESRDLARQAIEPAAAAPVRSNAARLRMLLNAGANDG